MLASGDLRASGEMEAMRTERKRDGRWHLNPLPSPVWMLRSQSCLSRQIKKRVRVDPGGGEAGLIQEDPRLHWPLALSVFPAAPLTYM